MTAATPVTAFLDASVLYPAMLRSVLLRLALADLYRPLWSDAVHEEWIAALLRNRPELDRTRLLRTRALMEAHLGQAMVTGYAPLIKQLTLPDPDDRHVLAAAIHGGASAIITVNLRDFPASALGPHGIEARHPDAFIRDLVERDPHEAVAALRDDRLSLKRPPKAVSAYIADLAAAGLPKTVATLQPFLEKL